MKIHSMRLNVLNSAIDKAFERNVRIKNSFGEWKVGWASLGAVSIDDATSFTDAVLAMVDIADMLTRREIETVYTEEFEEDIATEERFHEVRETLVEWLISKEYRKIEAWLVANPME